MAIQSRQVIMSGQNKYVPLNEFEKGSYLLEFFWTDLTTQFSQSVNLDWTPPRKFFGRVCFQAREYVVYEKLINFNNELLHSETNVARYLQHHASCMQIENNWLLLDALVSTRFITDTVLPTASPTEAIAAAAYLALRQNAQNFLNAQESSFTQQILQQQHKAYSQRPTPRQVLDGFSYSMENFASGQLTIRGYNFDEACAFPNTAIDSNPDNRASPPASAGGDDVAGGPGGTPPATGTGDPPPPGAPAAPSQEEPLPAPPPKKPGPTPDGTLPGVGYIVEYGWTERGREQRIRSTVLGSVSAWKFESPGPSPTFRTSHFDTGGGTPTPGRVNGIQWNILSYDNAADAPSGFFLTVIGRAPR